ncbi:winged helix DNA-binding domain-containing protein [Streptomyces sp. NBC_01725]|uniref:winged helix DNA-binding domain-containing protein n=1 Tax=Streptomyces sp. NBC_01725 TaxID=2975923 RepID=UPI002E298523|nr:winged helix DNA-binding domain-containing protein [Streptomyces sp. NBC_01725]
MTTNDTDVGTWRPSVSWAAANARRLARQGLTAPTAGGPAAVTGAMVGAHAQVLSAAELSVALRLDGGETRESVRAALWTDGSLVKTFGPRGTVHLLPSADLPLWTGALSALPAGRNAMPDGVRMSEDQTDQVVAAIADALADDDLTVDELTEEIVARTGPWAGDRVMDAFQTKWPRWRQMTHTAAHRGALCFGPNRGRKVTYTNPHRMLPGFTPLPGREALAGLVDHYLYAYGPATPQHFAKWLAMPVNWAKELFGSLAAQGRTERVSFEGDAAWVKAGDTDFPAASAVRGAVRGVRLLPYFDAFTIASQPRTRLFAGAAYERALGGGQAGNFPVLLIDGAVAGVWHQRRSGKWIDVTVEPLGTLTAAQRAGLGEQVERTGEILQGTPRLTVGTVSVGAHA